MYEDATPSSEFTPHLDIPESTQECLFLARMIEEQLKRWTDYRRADHTGTATPTIAAYIAEDSKPLDHDPIDYLSNAGFGGAMTREKAREQTEYEKRRAVLSQWAIASSFDTIPPYHAAFAEYLHFIGESAENLSTRPEYAIAAKTLYRLFIIREQLALKIGRISTLDISRFRQLATKLDNDFM
jgi:hypothetical protein